MDYLTLTKKYQDTIEEYYEQMHGKAKTILERGIFVCNNDKVTDPRLVLSGINPSYNPRHPEVKPFDFATASGSYWRKKHKQFGGPSSLLVQNHIAYLDLFPIRERHQNVFEKAFLSDNLSDKSNEFRFKMVSQTADAIEQLQPRLIVHANKSSLYYWGLNPISFEMDNAKPWLGYHFTPVENNCPILETYNKRVSDFRDGNGLAIPLEKRYVHLLQMSGRGLSKPVYFLTYIMEYYGMKDWQKVQLLSADEMTELWEWCKAN